MKMYEVIGRAARLASGMLSITPELAAARIHNLEKVGDEYRIMNPIEFKRGQIFGYDGKLPQDMAALVDAEIEIEADDVEPEDAPLSEYDLEAFSKRELAAMLPAGAVKNLNTTSKKKLIAMVIGD